MDISGSATHDPDHENNFEMKTLYLGRSPNIFTKKKTLKYGGEGYARAVLLRAMAPHADYFDMLGTEGEMPATTPQTPQWSSKSCRDYLFAAPTRGHPQ